MAMHWGWTGPQQERPEPTLPPVMERLRRAAQRRDTKERALIGEAHEMLTSAMQEVARLRAENAHLRERLEAIGHEAKLGGWVTHKEMVDAIAEILRERYPDAYHECFPPMAAPQ